MRRLLGLLLLLGLVSPAAAADVQVRITGTGTLNATTLPPGTYTITVNDMTFTVSGTPTALTATYVGIDADLVGHVTLTPDGEPDNHLVLTGLKAKAITKVRITDTAGGIWEFPYNGMNWNILLGPNGAGGADVWWSVFVAATTFTIAVTYADGSTDTAVVR